MKKPMKRLTIGLSVVLCGATTAIIRADNTILYQDSFTATGDLNGRAPETATNSFGASGTALWGTNFGAWTVNGSEAEVNTTGGQRGAWLSFTPQTGHIYTLSTDLNPISSGSSTGHWL